MHVSVTEVTKSSLVTEEPHSRRRAETVTPVGAATKIACGVACLSSPTCWGANFDPQGREGHKCELLSGIGMGLVASQGWGFQPIASVSGYSAP